MANENYTGLTEKEVQDSRARHGENVLTPPEKDPDADTA